MSNLLYVSINFFPLFLLPFTFSNTSFFIFSFVWRTSFSQSLTVVLLTTSFSFPLSKIVFISLSFLKDSFARYGIHNWHFFQYLKYIVALLSGLYCMRWETCCHLNWYSSVGNLSFLSGCFQKFFLLWFHFPKFNYDMSWYGCLWVYHLTHSVSWIYRFVYFTKFGKFFSYYFFKYSFSTVIFVLFFWDSNVMNVRSFVIVQRSLKHRSLFQSIFSLLFTVGRFYCSFSMFNNSTISRLWYTIKST